MLNLKSLGLAFALITTPSAAFAGWGAIAYNATTGASSETHGYLSYNAAVLAALSQCGVDCSIINWEINRCNALATRPDGAWGEGHGFYDTLSARNEALSRCGIGCTIQEWNCH